MQEGTQHADTTLHVGITQRKTSLGSYLRTGQRDVHSNDSQRHPNDQKSLLLTRSITFHSMSPPASPLQGLRELAGLINGDDKASCLG
jgi:hypothetical protein